MAVSTDLISVYDAKSTEDAVKKLAEHEETTEEDPLIDGERTLTLMGTWLKKCSIQCKHARPVVYA